MKNPTMLYKLNTTGDKLLSDYYFSMIVVGADTVKEYEAKGYYPSPQEAVDAFEKYNKKPKPKAKKVSKKDDVD